MLKKPEVYYSIDGPSSMRALHVMQQAQLEAPLKKPASEMTEVNLKS